MEVKNHTVDAKKSFHVKKNVCHFVHMAAA